MWSSPLDSWFLSSLYETLNGSYFESISPSWQGLINQNRGWVNSSVHNTDTVKQYYSQESTEYQYDYGPKIGLMYVSDCGYAADPSYWTTTMSQYSYTCASNWMYCGEYEWTMVQDSSTAGAFYADLFDSNNGSKIQTYAVRPVFYLKSDVIYVSGSGTQTDPYRIAWMVCFKALKFKNTTNKILIISDITKL